MRQRERVDRRIDELRRRVLEAAGGLFAKKGVEATKLDEICEAADVAKRTLCNHFPTKGDIVRAIAADSMQSRIALFDSARTEGRTTRERLKIVFDRLRALPKAHETAHQRELLGEFFRIARSHPSATDGEIQISDALVELLQAGRRAELPAGCSAETFAEVILGTISRITLEWVRRDDYDVDRHLSDASRFLVGLLRD